jgi:hypothetical protein
MLLYEMVIATGIAVILVLTAIGALIARLMMGPEEVALLREAREMPADMGELKRRIAGNDAGPVRAGSCCDDCNVRYVVPVRLEEELCAAEREVGRQQRWRFIPVFRPLPSL